MKKVTGSLQTQKDIYYAVLNLYDVAGKRKQKWISLGLPIKGNKRQAQAQLNELIAEYNEQAQLKSVMPKRQTNELKFLDYMHQWLKSVKGNIEEGTYSGYEICINSRMTEFFKKENPLLIEFSPQHLQKFYEFLREKGLSGNTQIHYHACIRKALNQAFKNGYVAENIADKVDRPKKDKYVASFYDDEELKTLFEVSRGDLLELLIFVTAYYGLRRSEVIGLKWEAIDFKNKTISIRHKVTETKVDGKLVLVAKDKLKTKSSHRVLPLLPEVEAKLQDEFERQKKNKKLCKGTYIDSDYIFVNDLGDLIRPNYVTQHFEILLKSKGLRKIRFHDLRHSCASLLLANQVEMKAIQEWMGHSNFSTTADLYAHLDHGSKLRSAGAIQNVLGSKNAN